MELWTVYWFMLPACIGIASAAMFSGISGAALLMPLFLIGFPLLGVPPLPTVAAIGMSLFLETSGFGAGVYRYLRRGLVDLHTAGRLAAVTLPAGILGAVAARWIAADGLRIGYGVAMVGLSLLLFREPTTPHPAPLHAGPDEDDARVAPRTGSGRRIVTADGTTYAYAPIRLPGQAILSGAGAIVAGLISTGVGEATLPGLVRRSGFPVAVAAATSTVVVAATVAGAALAHLVELTREGGLSAIPWNLLVWAVPGSLVGAFLGTHLQGRIPARVTRLFFATLFGLIGLTFLAVFGLGLGAARLS
jgi:uncharacterized membrane protein YfcA